MEQSLLPNSKLLNMEISNNQSSRTWLIKDNKIVGMVDSKEAIKQSIEIMLGVSRYEHLIYSWDYGHELNTLFGKDKSYIEIEAPRLIKECLLQDDRISSVDNFNFLQVDDGLLLKFEVMTIDGIVKSEVTI